jgi:hypothetical protein
MTRKKSIGKKEKVGVKLSLEERKLFLVDPIRIHKDLADPILGTPTGAPILLTLNELEDLGVTSQPKPITPRTRRSEKNSMPSSRRSTTCSKPIPMKSRPSH